MWKKIENVPEETKSLVLQDKDFKYTVLNKEIKETRITKSHHIGNFNKEI